MKEKQDQSCSWVTVMLLSLSMLFSIHFLFHLWLKNYLCSNEIKISRLLDCQLMWRFLRLCLSLHNSYLFCDSHFKSFDDEGNLGFKKFPMVSKWWTLRKINLILDCFSGMLFICVQPILLQSQQNVCHRKISVTELFIRIKTFYFPMQYYGSKMAVSSYLTDTVLQVYWITNKSPESQVQNSGMHLRGGWVMYF